MSQVVTQGHVAAMLRRVLHMREEEGQLVVLTVLTFRPALGVGFLTQPDPGSEPEVVGPELWRRFLVHCLQDNPLAVQEALLDYDENV